VGLHIGTRPDCINNELINFFVKLDKNYQITVELGLQSSNDKTLKFINRGHSSEDFTKACEKLRKAGLKICAHIILGLPGETEEDMLRTISFLNSNKVDSVKFHHLHIIKNTPLAKLYENKKIQILKEDEYIKILAESIARLPKKTIIARLVGDAPQNMLVAPDWPDSKIAFLNKLDTYMINNNLFQGKFNKT
jgi:radical SAM protein (TIGR01212 family)